MSPTATNARCTIRRTTYTFTTMNRVQQNGMTLEKLRGVVDLYLNAADVELAAFGAAVTDYRGFGRF
jgi:hypothetical protein